VFAVTALAGGSLLLAPAASGTAVSAQRAAQSAKADRTPLQVTLGTLAPATIPKHGRVTLTGTITNQSQDVWSDLKVYLVTSPTPILTRSELAEAAASDADAQVGNRRTTPGSYETVGDLTPGETVSYKLSVRRRDLGI
jgi:hypothetical protein